MCGIAGYRSTIPYAFDMLNGMLTAITHRGPDAVGVYNSPPFMGGVCRLRINDLINGDQPLYNADRSVVLLYNGEIYNYATLRRELETKGYQFTTQSDGEVICHLYDEYGESLFEHLDGMFAVALWVEGCRKLILARDLPGEKPLYYANLRKGGLVFASELKGIKRFPGLNLSLNLQALWDFPTFLWIPEPITIYEGVFALPRGHILVADDNHIVIRPFDNRFGLDSIPDDDTSIVTETRRVVTEAVRSRLMSDVPVGCFLSSGLDSSIVANIAARDLESLATFSIGLDVNVTDPFHGSSFDESAAAAAYARQLGTDHHTIHIAAQDCREDLQRFCHAGDQPFAVSSGLGILAIARAARDAGIKVLLSGDGADELFGGYSWYTHHGHSTLPPTELVWHYNATEIEKAKLYSPDVYAGAETSLRYFKSLDSKRAWKPEELIYHDRDFYLPNEMLRKLDHMTMAQSVEGRAPFVALAVLSHAEKLSYRHMIRDGILKWALRAAFENLLPSDVINRPKHGFNIPIDHWLRSEWADLVEEAFAPGSALQREGFLASNADRVAKQMLEKPLLIGHTIFSFIMLNLWLEQDHRLTYS